MSRTNSVMPEITGREGPTGVETRQEHRSRDRNKLQATAATDDDMIGVTEVRSLRGEFKVSFLSWLANVMKLHPRKSLAVTTLHIRCECIVLSVKTDTQCKLIGN